MKIDKIKIDRSSPEPLYQQLKAAILNLIWNNEFLPGEIIPTEEEF